MRTADATQPASTRVSIARLAEQVVARTPGVSATPGGGRWLTQDGERAIAGVIVGAAPAGRVDVERAAPAGRVDVELHLVGAWPPEPLPPLAERLRRELTASATGAGLADRLGAIEISVHDLEPAAAAVGAGR